MRLEILLMQNLHVIKTKLRYIFFLQNANIVGKNRWKRVHAYAAFYAEAAVADSSRCLLTLFKREGSF